MIETIAKLRLEYGATDGDILDCGGTLYKYDADSELEDNGISVIRPILTAAGRWIKLAKNELFTSVAKNVTATLTAAEMLSGAITSTSAAAVGLTMPTAEAVMALIPGGGIGTSFDLLIDNSAGANTVTMVVGTGFTVSTPAVTGGDTLTISTDNKVGLFRFYFTSLTAAKVYRIF